MIYSFLKIKISVRRGAPQENDAKFRFAIHQQGIRQFHDNCKIANLPSARLLPHWRHLDLLPFFMWSVWLSLQ